MGGMKAPRSLSGACVLAGLADSTETYLSHEQGFDLRASRQMVTEFAHEAGRRRATTSWVARPAWSSHIPACAALILPRELVEKTLFSGQ